MRPSTKSAVAILLAFASGCGGVQPTGGDVDDGSPGKVEIVEYEKRAAELIAATATLSDMRGQLDEQRRRLALICNEYPDNDVCKPQTAARYAREAFCADTDFTQHVDNVVEACHQGACKQVDQAELISRQDYMLLTQRLPHQLITFRAAETKLDGKDKAQLQTFLETLEGEKGYVIVVGRASKDGPWRANLRYALKRAENTRGFLVRNLGLDKGRVGYITYGHEKMYLTKLDADRLAAGKISVKQANRSALVFSYPCYQQ